MENQENNNGQLQIELKEEVAQGTYANLAIITHSSSEFILDFIRYRQESGDRKLRSPSYLPDGPPFR